MTSKTKFKQGDYVKITGPVLNSGGYAEKIGFSRFKINFSPESGTCGIVLSTHYVFHTHVAIVDIGKCNVCVEFDNIDFACDERE